MGNLRDLMKRISTKANDRAIPHSKWKGSKHRAAIMIPCVCGAKFWTRRDLSIHMAVECLGYSQFIL